MQRRLLFKFALIYLLIGLGSFVALSTIGSRRLTVRLAERTGRALYKAATEVAKDPSLLSDTGRRADDSTEAEHLFLRLKQLAAYQGAEIWLMSDKGVIRMNTAQSTPGGDEVLSGFDPIALGSNYYSIGRFFGHFSEDQLSVLAPITGNLALRGYVAIHLPLRDLYQMRERLLAEIHLFCLLIYAAFFALMILLYFSVLRPLRTITDGARQFAAGNLQYRIPVKSQDELGALATALNVMADELQKSDAYERNFIANVSHDFRSPLTSMRGFIEAILDGTIPPEMHEHYLRIVLGETERLTKLTNGILLLNSMDRRQNLLSLKAFDINAVIRSTAALFEGTCRPRQISIRLSLTGETLYCFADEEKIQQVLYNLLDNAIKFSPDSAEIEVKSDLVREKIFISVKDHGAGIPTGSLTKIWERFYKTDASRGREKKGNGLGLAIVKEILQLHHQNISVVSTEGVGTEFIFSLAASPTEIAPQGQR